MANDCIFCKLVAGEIPSKKLYEDDEILAFYDIHPQAPIHFLVVPKTHISGISAITPEQGTLIAHIYTVIVKLTAELGVDQFRVVTNNGTDAGQTVFHLHLHVLGGAVLGGMA